ncbi:arsenical resistance protein ArsH [bacterium A37T11]|nr:arsenical resistance protein ArsH [bacterium A37T11]
MKILIFNGALESRIHATSHKIAQYFKKTAESYDSEVAVFNLSEAGIPLFDHTLDEVPTAVQDMNRLFREADVHIWLTPLYHGSMTGAMKNCLDWLEISAKESLPYLTNKVVGLVCWADGGQAMQGINAMDAVAKALRAWVLPYSIPIVRGGLYDTESGEFTDNYLHKFNMMARMLTKGTMPSL